MKNSVKFSTRRLQADKWFIPLILILAFAGFVDATYLTISHFRGTALACTISNGCETVTTSAYATLFGLPVALLGLLFYLTTFILIIAYLDLRKEVFAKIIFWLSLVAVCFSIWFVAVQAFILDSFCQYCLVSALISALIFGVSFAWHHQARIVD
ncbi:MAG: Vitamin K epoxide reductase [Parcubacteria group bacterium GW2011_GWA1_43_21]|uniref:Vitamin K epoxide reductase domain-containing protein n=1 Tax=Candidatus Vogelbacteria bacterium RIFOXYB1_FULL_42_16 TaxID=1802436 RepID=A0A1G2QC85_9BACT|nr:MAG: Vitamin K epoxide reductase [Parcubacteria group bacterium GW2011_GWB1_42_9]KKT09174.1 MAG: Vitamin K epoxide reductase [Parcubacteria group bacterium GW2011_GWA1_43_21]OHA58023.1 MAG: hypothetical protein A2370_01215 [Candidatus Vogelbacteria bacterium RIFOXYB1_FULL_42_16]